MTLRDRLLFATSALLYSGPLYAGLAGYDLSPIVLFAGFLTVWLFIVRPGDWPERRTDWTHPRAIAWPMLVFAAQIVVAGFCVATGRIIAVMFDISMPLPLAAPAGLSLAGILLAWGLRRRRPAAPILRRRAPRWRASLSPGSGILDTARPRMPGRIDAQTFAEDIAAALGDLGNRPAPDAALDALAALIAEKGMTRSTFEALETAGRLTAPQIQLLVRLALTPAMLADLAGQGRIGVVLERALCGDEDTVAAGTARLALARLERTPGLADELPHAARLRHRAGPHSGTQSDQRHETATALLMLADRLDPQTATLHA